MLIIILVSYLVVVGC